MSTYQWDLRFTGAREAAGLATLLDKLDTLFGVLTRRAHDQTRAQHDTATAYQRTARAAANVHTETVKTADGFTKITTETDRLGKVLKVTVDELNKTTVGTTRTRKVMDGLGNTLKETSEHLEDHAKKTEKLPAAYSRSGRSVKTFGQKLIRLLSNFNTVNKAFDFAAKRARQFATGLTAVFSFVFDKAGKFEESAAALRAYGDEYGEVSKKAAELAQTSRFTSTQAAQAAIELKKAGQSNTDAMESMQPVLTASAANSISLGKAAGIAANGMAQFSRFGTTAKETLEVLTGGAMSATTDMSQLASAMKNAAPISSLLGQDITKVTTALAMMAKNGITAGRAGTSWKIAMERLSAPTPQATKNLRALGISFKDLDLSDPARMLDTFRQAIAKIPKESEQIRMLKPVFGRSIGAILPMIQAGKAGFDQMTEAVTKNRSAMADLDTEKAKTMQHAYLMAQSAAEGLAIQLKDFLGVPITAFFQTAADAILKVKDRLADVSDGFGAAGMGVDEWITAIQSGDFSGMFSGLEAEFAEEIETIKGIISGLKTLAVTWFRELWDGLVDDNVIAKVSTFAGQVMDALFSSENTAKAAKFGMDLGTQVVKGFASTTKGKLAIGALGVMGGAKVVGGAMATYGALKGAGSAAGGAGGLAAVTGKLGAAFSNLTGVVTSVAGKLGAVLGVGGATVAGAGAAVGGAVVVGNMLAGQADAWGRNQGRQETVRGATALSTGIQELSAKRKTASPDMRKRIDAQIATMTKELNSLGGTGMIEESRKRAEAEVAAANTESPEEALRRKNQAILDQGNLEEVAAAIEASHAKDTPSPQEPEAQGPETLAEMSTEELSAKKEILSVQQQIAEAERAQKTAMDEITTATDKAQLDFSKYAEALETWLVRPFSKFQEAINSAKEKFGGMIDGLKSKKIDLSEKFGLSSPEDAAKDREKVLKDANKRDEKLLAATEDPAKKAEIQERMADRLAKAADAAEGPERQRLAKQAAKLLDGAEDSTGDAQEDELKRVEIRKQFAQKNVGLLEGMLDKTESAGGKAAILEQLQGMYMDLGEREKANANSGALEEAKMQAAVEDAEMRKQSFEIQKIQLEVMQRQLEQLTALAQDSQSPIPEDPAFAV